MNSEKHSRTKRLIACFMAVMMLLTAVPLSAFAANKCDHIYEAQGLVKVALVGKKYVVSDETYKCVKCNNETTERLYRSDEFNTAVDSAKAALADPCYKTTGKEYFALKSAVAALTGLADDGTHYSKFILAKIDNVNDALKSLNSASKESKLNTFTVKFVAKDSNGKVVEDSQKVFYAESANAPASTFAENYSDNEKHYTFKKWDASFDSVRSNLVINAVYDEKAHNFEVTENKVEPTCTTTGKSEVKTCKDCKKSVGGEEIAALGHSWGPVSNDYFPEKTAKTCTRCKVVYTEHVKYDAHQPINHEVKRPTCTEPGYKAYKTCKTCSWTNYEAVPPTGHTIVVDKAVAPTCTAAGKTEGQHCSVCKAVIVAQKAVPALGHDPQEVKSDDYKKTSATCTTPDIYYKSCSRCAVAIKSETFTGKALGHNFIKKNIGIAPIANRATCTEPAAYYYICSVCGSKSEKTYTVGTALGHDFTDYIEDAGKGTETRRCERDGCTEKETLCVLKDGKRNHKIKLAEKVDSTCTTDGHTAYEYCEKCGYKNGYEVIPAAHKPGKTEKAVKKLATCTAAGEEEESVYCMVKGCEKLINTKTNTVAALGHDYSEWKANEDGKTHTRICNREDCGSVITEAHKIIKVEAKDVTCLTDGVEAGEKCEVCSYNTSKVIPAKGSHTEEILPAVAATCTTPGKTEGKKCTVCGEMLVAQTDIPANGHTEEIIPEVAATCTTPGKTEGKKCSVCGEMLVAPTEIPATGHDMVTDTEEVPATCLVDGHTKGEHCSRCDYKVESQVIMSVGHHTEEIIPKVDATCTTPGTTEGKKCSVCGEMLEEYEIIPATGHSPVTTIVKASVSKDGTKTEKCENCDFVETSSIPKISTVVLTKTAVAYNGKAQAPTVVVKDAEGVALSKNIDYKVTYKNNVNPGVGSAVITFIGDDYEGSKTLTFKITPTATAKIVAKQNASAIKVAWSAVKGATGYRVQLYYGKKLVRTRTTDKRTWTFTKLNSSANYKIVVTPFVKSGNTVVYGGARTISTATKPAAPQNVKLAAGKGRIVAQWNKVSGATGYTVFYSLKKDGKYKYVNVKGNKANLKNLKSGRTYYIKVTANKKLGDKVLRSVPTKVKSATVK